MEGLTIGKVASNARVNVMTVRYYEKRGLISSPPRLRSGYRCYPPEVITQIKFIKRAQKLGFSLNEISELLSLRVRANDSCKKIKRRAEKKILEIEAKIRSLQKMKEVLLELTVACENRSPTHECPIVEALEH